MASREVSTMIKQGFIADPAISLSFSPSRAAPVKLYSPSSSPPSESARSSHNPTLFDMMSEEQHRECRTLEDKSKRNGNRLPKFPMVLQGFKDSGLGPGDVRLTVVSTDGYRVSMDVHKRVLAEKSRFFAETLSQRTERGVCHSVEISECDDVEIYAETVVLMYYDDLKKCLTSEDVNKVLALLKVSADISFEAGINSCLEYLEAVPWSEEEEVRILNQINQLELQDSASRLLQRVSFEPSTSTTVDDIFSGLLDGVLLAKDDKARREMKALVLRLLRGNSSDNDQQLDVSKDTLYHFCHRCISSLLICLSEASSADDSRQDRGTLMVEIAREADSLQWIVDILIDKRLADEFVKLWSDQRELAILHSKIPTMYRHEISRITAQLCIAIGRGQILVARNSRSALLSTWLEALYDDFGWMRRASRSVDRKLVEDGLSKTILTLSLQQQHVFLLTWFDRFLNNGDDCPNIQRAFEVWWRRAFIRQYLPEQGTSKLQISVRGYPH